MVKRLSNFSHTRASAQLFSPLPCWWFAQIHLVVFLIGIFHVLYSASVFLISFQVIKRWKVWEEEFNPAGTSSSDVRETDKNTVRKPLEAL